MSGRLKLGVLVSGAGTNLQAILDAIEKGRLNAEVCVVISNVENAPALERARRKAIPAEVVCHSLFASREAFEEAVSARLDRAAVQLIALAGFMRVLSPAFVRRYAGRIMNVHPALLPAFPGTDAIEKAWAYGVKTTGVTVHFVDEGTDTGPIILQRSVALERNDTLESLAGKIHEVEHQIYPEAIQLYAEGRLKTDGRRVLIGGDS